jgi:hypothetical protein
LAQELVRAMQRHKFLKEAAEAPEIIVPHNILMFVTWSLPQLTARTFFSNQLEAGFLTN